MGRRTVIVLVEIALQLAELFPQLLILQLELQECVQAIVSDHPEARCATHLWPFDSSPTPSPTRRPISHTAFPFISSPCVVVVGTMVPPPPRPKAGVSDWPSTPVACALISHTTVLGVLDPDPLDDGARPCPVVELDELDPDPELPLFFALAPFGELLDGMFILTYVVSE